MTLRLGITTLASTLLLAPLGANAQEEASPDSVRSVTAPTPVVAPPQAVPYDGSTPLFTNPRPGVFVPVTLPPSGVPAVRANGGMPTNAFIVELRIGGGAYVEGNGSVAGGVLSPSLLLGARLIDRLQVGMGMSFVRIGENGFSSNNILFMPTIAVDVFKSRDNKNALYLKAGLGFGASVASYASELHWNALLGVDVALGARHALSSNFGLGFEAGLAANVTSPGDSTQTDVVFVYGALVGSFWAGR